MASTAAFETQCTSCDQAPNSEPPDLPSAPERRPNLNKREILFPSNRNPYYNITEYCVIPEADAAGPQRTAG